MYIIQKLSLGIFLVIVLVILWLHNPVTALLLAAVTVLLFLLLGFRLVMIEKLTIWMFLAVVLFLLWTWEPVTGLCVAAVTVLLFLLLRKPNGRPSREKEDDRLY